MEASLAHMDPGLQQILLTLSGIVADVSVLLRTQEGDVSDKTGTQNEFGDVQLQVDCAADELIFQRLASCSACCAASSEEQPEMRQLRPQGSQGDGYTVVFDPLDGSSIVGACFAVGTIFGVWPGSGVVGRCGRQQAAAAYAVYGPRTLLVWACPGPGGGLQVQQWVLGAKGEWKLLAAPTGSEGAALIAPTKPIFAPANMRCCVHNLPYRALVDSWVDRGFALRYTGGMVPDVHHILAKGGGVFVNPCSAAAPAKLRLVYECAPLAFIIEAAGGASHDGNTSILDVPISSTTQRSAIVLGSTLLVQESATAMTYQPVP